MPTSDRPRRFLLFRRARTTLDDVYSRIDETMAALPPISNQDEKADAPGDNDADSSVVPRRAVHVPAA